MKYIIGIDEVGRGPLAGPIAVGVCLMPAGFRIKSGPCKLRDSKRLSAKNREKWLCWLKSEIARCRGSQKIHLTYAISRVYQKQIDRINISASANLAAYKACRKVLKEIGAYKQRGIEVEIYLDGGLYIKSKNYQVLMIGQRFQGVRVKFVKTVIAGDEKITAVKLASITAKVSRDRYMESQHKKYPFYNFDRHKGYGTKEHLKAVRRYGPCPIHRLTFLNNYRKIKQQKLIKLRVAEKP
jgi:ribonuclease HII